MFFDRLKLMRPLLPLPPAFPPRAAALINSTHNEANLQKIMTKIGAICLITIGVWIVIELAVQFGHYDHSCGPGEEACPTLTNMLVILVGGIPIAMPTVLSVTLALGAAALAKEGAIVARMSAVEEMAGMDILCSDKTGTLTLNKLSIEPQSIHVASEGYTIDDVMKHGALSTNIVTEEPIDMVLYNSYPNKVRVYRSAALCEPTHLQGCNWFMMEGRCVHAHRKQRHSYHRQRH